MERERDGYFEQDDKGDAHERKMMAERSGRMDEKANGRGTTR